LIYTDFGVLIPGDREILLQNIYKALKPGGLFIFDVINAKKVAQKFQETRNWTFETSGFWKDGPYLELGSGYHYPESFHKILPSTSIWNGDNITFYKTQKK
jgi:SAM-dependent methyltransferase